MSHMLNVCIRSFFLTIVSRDVKEVFVGFTSSRVGEFVRERGGSVLCTLGTGSFS